MNKLYIRIWLAVVLAVAVLTLLVGWAWRMAADPPLRELVVRNQAGEIVGQGQANMGQMGHPGALRGRFGEGPEFEVRMQDGRTLHMHLPRPSMSPWRMPMGFLWTLGLVAVAVALATYPIVRRLTRRLEALQRSVEQWGDGDLRVRTPVGGNDEIAFLASRFNRAAEQIESLLHSRDALLASQKSLLANASHELRSPLTRIRMGLELMGTGDASLPAKLEIARNIDELDQLIGEILLASRLDAQEADLGTVESVDLIGMVAEECAHTEATLVLEAGLSSLCVPGVAKLLRRAIRNLLENARRYGAGTVTVHLSQDNGTTAVIAVSDQGPGVPGALQQRIFEPFYRLPGASEREGGVGLGLALVKSIAQRHKGSVACSHNSGSGACFTIRLPL